LFVFAFVFALFQAERAGAQTLGEADVIRLARKNNPQSAVLANEVSVRQSIRNRTGLRDSPTLAWDREHLPSASESEDSIVVSLPIHRSKGQQVQRALAEVAVAEAQSEALVGGGLAVRRALELFYRSLAQQQRISIAEESWKRLEEATRVVTRRREEGRVSGYDLARVELETELARSGVEEARTTLSSLKSELAPLLGVAASGLQLQGSLGPASLGETSTGVPESPALAALRASAGLATNAKRDAQRRWVPMVSVAAGFKVVNGQERNYGYVAGVSLSLPIWTGTSALREEMAAREQKLNARVGALATERSIRGASALKTLQGLRTEAQRFEAATGTKVESLALATESGYREGQRTLMELLDASRTLSSVRVRQLDLHLAIKKAEVALRDSRGEFE